MTVCKRSFLSRVSWSGALLVCLWFSAAPSSAQPAVADTLFQEGLRRARAGQYLEAIGKFQASYQLDPARGTLLGLAMAEERAGRLADALGHFSQLKELAEKAGDNPRVEAATQALADLDPRVPRLTVVVKGEPPEQLELRLNGRELPRGAIGSPLPLNPGKNQITATAPGYHPFEFAAALPERERTTVELDLLAKSSPAEPEPSPQARLRRNTGQIGGLVVGGLGVALLVGGTYFWFRSGDTYSELSNRCPNNTCPASAQAQIDSGREQEVLGRVGLIMGAAALAGGVTWYVLTRPERASSGSLSVGLSAGSVRFGGAF